MTISTNQLGTLREKLRELKKAHDLEFSINISASNVWDIGRVYIYSARKDHIEVLKGLGVLTNWFHLVEQDSSLLNEWKFLVVPH